MKVSFTKEWNRHHMVLLLFTICLHVTGAESLIHTENYYQQFRGDLSFNSTIVITTFRLSQVECFLACNEANSCITVVTQETNNNSNSNIFVKMDNSPIESSSGSERLMCSKGNVEFINTETKSIKRFDKIAIFSFLNRAVVNS